MVLPLPLPMAMGMLRFMRMSVVSVSVHVTISMLVPVVHVGFAVGMGVFIKNQGFDSHWHRVRGHSDASQINEIKAPQGHAIDHQKLALYARVFLENMAQVVCNVAIGDNEQGPLLRDRVGKG